MDKPLKLGVNQKMALRQLIVGGHYPGTWIMFSHGTTLKILDTLVTKGLADKIDVNGHFKYRYEVNPKGKEHYNFQMKS